MDALGQDKPNEKAPQTRPTPRATTRARRIIDIVSVAAVVAFAFVLGFVAEFSGDFHWHLVLGDWSLANHAIYRHDTVSHTFLGAPMHVSAWLGDVLLALAFHGGYPGVYVLRGFTLALAAFALIRTLQRFGLATYGAAALAGVWLAEGSLRFFLRPEIFGLACFAFVLERLAAVRMEDRLRVGWPLLPLIVLWANVHGSVNIGLMVIGITMSELALRRAMVRRFRDAAAALGFVGLAAVAACASPEGLGTILVYRMLTAGCNLQFEWAPMTLSRLSVTAACIALGAILTTVAALFTAPRRMPLAPIVVSAALVVLTARHMRFQNVMLLSMVVAIGAGVGVLSERVAKLRRADLGELLGATLAVFVFAGGVATAEEADVWHELSLREAKGIYPTAACDFVRTNPPPGKMLNSFNMASYLMHCLQGSTPVAIDQRVCSIYPGPFYTDYITRFGSQPTALADDLDASFAFVEHDQSARTMSADRDHWRLLYVDDAALVFVRLDRPETAVLARASEVEPLAPWALEDLAVPANPASLAAAKRAVEVQSSRCPECDVTALAKVALAAGMGDAEAVKQGLADLAERAKQGGYIVRLPERLQLFPLLAARAAGASGDMPQFRAEISRYLSMGGRKSIADRATSQVAGPLP